MEDAIVGLVAQEIDSNLESFPSQNCFLGKLMNAERQNINKVRSR